MEHLTRINLGHRVVMTAGVNEDFEPSVVMECLCRHHHGDWGDLCAEDKEANDIAHRTNDGRLFSAYNTDQGKLWIITDGLCDPSVRATTVLRPSDY